MPASATSYAIVLSKQHRLRHSVEIRQVRHHGKSWHNRYFILVKRANESPDSRFAFSVSRRTGNAVMRNRVKRLMRESIRQSLNSIQSGWDVLLIARQPAREATFSQVDRAVKELLARSQLCPRVDSAQPTARATGAQHHSAHHGAASIR
jgi:ribonuclease P protein component